MKWWLFSVRLTANPVIVNYWMRSLRLEHMTDAFARFSKYLLDHHGPSFERKLYLSHSLSRNDLDSRASYRDGKRTS